MVKLQDFAGAVLVVALSVGGAHGAAYLKLGDIKGEVQESAMRGAWIEIDSVSWGATSADGKHHAWITLGEDPVAVGLLLPAVQKVHLAHRRLQPPTRQLRLQELARRAHRRHRQRLRPQGQGRDRVEGRAGREVGPPRFRSCSHPPRSWRGWPW